SMTLFFTDAVDSVIYSLSLHDALPICSTIKTKYSKINTIKKYTPNDVLATSVNSKVLQDFVNKLVENNYSQKIIQDFFSLVRNILKFAQKKYKLNNLSFLEDVIIPKKAPTREEIIAKRENYLEMHEVYK